MEWARILAYITGTVDRELLLRNEYLAAENRILKAQLKGRLSLSDAERAKLGEIGHRLGRKALGEVATAALPETILAWYRRLVARKFDGSRARRTPGRPRIDREVEELIVRMAKENRSWGYDRIAVPVYEAHGVSDIVGVFPITIIEAASDGETIRGAQCNRDLCGWNCPVKLYEVPFFHTGLRAWHEDEMRFVADIESSR
jgi:hypothetical protein